MDTSLAWAWQRALNFVVQSPEKIIFGGGKETKHARDSQCTILLDQNAVEDAINNRVHPDDPFCTPNKLKEYHKEYTPEYPADTFDYTYFRKLREGFDVSGSLENKLRKESGYFTYPSLKDGVYHNNLDQIAILRYGLHKQIDEQVSSNRNVAILFNPLTDNFSGKSTPCWNEVLIRWIGGEDVSIHTTFRSHDLWGAWEANMCSIAAFLDKDVVKVCGCRIKYWHESNYSLHIYDSDVDSALSLLRKRSLKSRNPITIGKQNTYDNITHHKW